MNAVQCPALFISAMASGQGKTTITAGLARYHRNQGLNVRVFKTGPDYLDPLILEQAAGSPAEQLDLWMMGEDLCRQYLYEAAKTADLILIEGVMGLYDGNPSGADLAEFFGIPVVAVISAPKMAQTVGALALGLKSYRPSLPFAGIIANNLGSQRHCELVIESMPKDIPVLATFRKSDDMVLPERHLGLVRPHEIEDYDTKLDSIANIIAETGLADLPNPLIFKETSSQNSTESKPLTNVKIGIAKDEAFSFIYPANVRFLESHGAELHYFSPMHDDQIPDVDCIWLPGGYPELHLEALSKNKCMKAALIGFYESGKTILAECGGMLYIQESLTTLKGETWPMAGLISGHGFMRPKGGCQGMQSAMLPEGEVRGHAHHRSRSEQQGEPIAFGKRISHPAPGEPIFRSRGLTTSYLHLYFPSNRSAMIELFTANGLFTACSKQTDTA